MPFNVAIVRWVRGAFTFRGRATRSEYWWPRLLVFGVNLVCLIVFVGGVGVEGLEEVLAWLEAEGEGELPTLPPVSMFALVFLIVFGLLTLLPDLAVTWRRFHDLNMPGWIHLLFLLGGVFFSLLGLGQLIWLAFPGTRGPNRFGPDPLFDQADIF